MNTIQRIQKIFNERFHAEINEESFSKDVSIGATGIGLDAIGMFYLIHFIETEFNIKFKREHIVSGVIRTLAGLCQTINELQKEEIAEVEKVAYS
jgi:acyl carrier protein